MTMGTNLKVWLVGLVLLTAAVSPALVCGDEITSSQYWKNQIEFPNDSFCSETGGRRDSNPQPSDRQSDAPSHKSLCHRTL